jgi:hypothetical protein
LNAGVELVTPETAAKLMEHYSYELQRDLRPWHVERLAAEMLRGTFKPTSILVAYCEETNSHHLLDGQHRIAAIRQYGKPVPLFINRITVKTPQELAEWYANTDQNMIRPMLNGLKVMGLHQETGLTEHHLKHVAAAVKTISDGFQQASISGSLRGHINRSVAVRAGLIRDWAAEARAFIDCTNKAPKALRGPLFRQPVLGVGLVTFRYQPEFADLFWRAVGDNDGLRRGEPAYALVNHLYNLDSRIPNNVLARHVANCWNAFMNGKELTRVYVKGGNRPILIKGTPYTGRAYLKLDEAGTFVEEEPEEGTVLEAGDEA